MFDTERKNAEFGTSERVLVLLNAGVSDLFVTLRGSAWIPSLISAMSGVLGSLIGGSATVATTGVSQRNATSRELVRDELRKREGALRRIRG